VAVEHRLTAEQFLEETCMKAGLPADAWKDPRTEVYGFTAEIFSEGAV
jgi:AMMECR1 domain-containing protein